ncbi:MAG: redoxin domain-containing protein [Planctomycetota bacterium]|jgi:peroxiredoxin
MKKILTFTIVILTITLMLYADSHEKSSKPGPEPGQKAPNFTLKNHEGKTVSLADYKGKTVVLEWFNYDCPFVQYHYEDKKTMSELAAKYKNKNVVWLTVNSTNYATQQTNKKYATKHNVTHAILDDSPGKVGKAYKATNTPQMIIVDKNGNVAYNGAIDNSPNGRTPAGKELKKYVDKALTELTSGQKVGTPKTKPYGCSVKYAR